MGISFIFLAETFGIQMIDIAYADAAHRNDRSAQCTDLDPIVLVNINVSE